MDFEVDADTRAIGEAVLRFVEREGYDVKYSTNIDTHTAPARLLGPRRALTAPRLPSP